MPGANSMQTVWAISRRAFLKVTGAAIFLRAALRGAPVAAGSIPARGFEVLDERQVATLDAICAQIIPTDEDPGAREARVVRYIDRVLVRQQRYRQPVYTAGLEATDRTSVALGGRPFVELEFEEQTRVLKAIESGEVTAEHWPAVASPEFFQLVWLHTIEGFYGEPKYGGNADRVSWKMIGYPLEHRPHFFSEP
jgi:gluconate 2-dehydrogenase gamma chain